MLLLGHAGITLGAAMLLNSAFSRSYSPGVMAKKAGESSLSPRASPARNPSLSNRTWGLTSLANRIDIRLLLVASFLPDIIDKPVGWLFLSNGRIFCHSLLFLVIITLAGLFLYRRYRKTWLLVLSFGTFTHLIFDQMWLYPRTLLWPLYGFTFEKVDIADFMQNIWLRLHTDPGVYMPEIIGAGILIWFVLALVRRGKVYAFIRDGRTL